VKSALSTLEVLRPRTLGQALRAMANGPGEDRLLPLAGGTDLFVYLNAGTLPPCRFLDLWPLAELRGIRTARQGMRLGALTTFSEIREHASLRRRYPSLVAAAAEVGGRQIQNRATLAGNIANASPAGDSLPPLLALDAQIHARSVREARIVPFAKFYRGYRDLALERDELIEAIELPTPPARSVQFFRKVGTRRAQSISKVVFAGIIRRDHKGRIDFIRLAYGSVAPIPLRARAAEEALLGDSPKPVVVERARAALLDDISPIDDIRSDREYRTTVAGNLLEQFLHSTSSLRSK
jgi:CO/xanthine dehydrogenase FAD-binding subunit